MIVPPAAPLPPRRVLVRVRPVLPHEEANGGKSTMLSLNPPAGSIGTVTKNGVMSNYQVDAVVDSERSQEEVFAAAPKPMAEAAISMFWHAAPADRTCSHSGIL